MNKLVLFSIFLFSLSNFSSTGSESVEKLVVLFSKKAENQTLAEKKVLDFCEGLASFWEELLIKSNSDVEKNTILKNLEEIYSFKRYFLHSVTSVVESVPSVVDSKTPVDFENAKLRLVAKTLLFLLKQNFDSTDGDSKESLFKEYWQSLNRLLHGKPEKASKRIPNITISFGNIFKAQFLSKYSKTQRSKIIESLRKIIFQRLDLIHFEPFSHIEVRLFGSKLKDQGILVQRGKDGLYKLRINFSAPVKDFSALINENEDHEKMDLKFEKLKNELTIGLLTPSVYRFKSDEKILLNMNNFFYFDNSVETLNSEIKNYSYTASAFYNFCSATVSNASGLQIDHVYGNLKKVYLAMKSFIDQAKTSLVKRFFQRATNDLWLSNTMDFAFFTVKEDLKTDWLVNQVNFNNETIYTMGLDKVKAKFGKKNCDEQILWAKDLHLSFLGKLWTTDEILDPLKIEKDKDIHIVQVVPVLIDILKTWMGTANGVGEYFFETKQENYSLNQEKLEQDDLTNKELYKELQIFYEPFAEDHEKIEVDADIHDQFNEDGSNRFLGQKKINLLYYKLKHIFDKALVEIEAETYILKKEDSNSIGMEAAPFRTQFERYLLYILFPQLEKFFKYVPVEQLNDEAEYQDLLRVDRELVKKTFFDIQQNQQKNFLIFAKAVIEERKNYDTNLFDDLLEYWSLVANPKVLDRIQKELEFRRLCVDNEVFDENLSEFKNSLKIEELLIWLIDKRFSIHKNFINFAKSFNFDLEVLSFYYGIETFLFKNKHSLNQYPSLQEFAREKVIDLSALSNVSKKLPSFKKLPFVSNKKNWVENAFDFSQRKIDELEQKKVDEQKEKIQKNNDGLAKQFFEQIKPLKILAWNIFGYCLPSWKSEYRQGVSEQLLQQGVEKFKELIKKDLKFDSGGGITKKRYNQKRS